MKKMSIIKRVKDYCIEYTRCIYDADRVIKKVGAHDEKLLQSYVRAKREILNIIRLNLNADSCLLTLTYKENMNNYNRAYRDFKNFVDRLKYSYNMSLCYLRIIELQHRGAIHFHVVIFNKGFYEIPYNEIYKLWGYGAIHVRRIDDFDVTTFEKVGNYLAKYLSKSKNIAWNKRIYTCSRNVKRIPIERKVIDDENLFNYYDELCRNNTDIEITIDDYRCKKYIKGI